MFTLFQKEEVMKQIYENEEKYNYKYGEQEIERILERVKKENKESLSGDCRSVRTMLQNLSDEQFNQLARQLAYPRGQRINNQAAYQTYLRAKKLNGLMHSLGKNNLDLLGLDLNTVKNFFVNNLSNSFGRYLKTPSVIVTYNDMRTTGGHNLSSKISRVNSLQNYKRDGGVRYAETSEPAEKQPASEKPRTPNNNNVPQATKPKTTPATPSTSVQKPLTSQNIRPREEVISGRERVHRGF
jgi:hypothetical protein